MRLLYVELNQEEAGDRQILEVLDRFCLGASLSGTTVVRTIGPSDQPDAGIQPNMPGPFNPDSGISLNPSNLDTKAIFGQGAPGSPPTLPPPAPSTAAVVPPSTAPAALPGSLPAPPGGVVQPAQNLAPTGVAPSGPAALTNPAGVGELDSTGLPWDERIHSGAKTKTDKGQWRAKKGLNQPALTASIEAELRQRVASMTGTAAVPAATVAPAVFQATQQAAAATAALPPPPPPAPVVPPPAAGPTMASLMSKMSPHMTSGLFSTPRQTHLFNLVGVSSLPELMPRQDLIEKLDPLFDQWIAYWQQLAAAGHPHTTVTA